MKTSVKFLLAGCFALALCSSPLVHALPQSDQTIPNPNLNSNSAIIRWNAWTTDHYYRAYAPQGAHQLAELTTAVHDALNTIDSRYNYFLGDVSDDVNLSGNDKKNSKSKRISNASPDAAIAGVYSTLLPVLFADLQLYNAIIPSFVFNADDLASLNSDLQAFTDAQLARARSENRKLTDQQVSDGLAVGAAAANAIHNARATDGHNRYQFYQPAPPTSYSGQWRTIGSQQMAYAQYGDIKPFALDAITNYFSPPPPALNDLQYIADLKEIFNKGTDGTGIAADPSVESTTTPEELNLALWMNGIGADKMNNYWLQSFLPRDYPSIAKDLWASARIFALLQVATIDANTVNQYNKRIWNFWRPRDAIESRNAIPPAFDAHGNPVDGLESFRVGPRCSQIQCWNPNVAYAPLTPTNTDFEGIGPNTPEWPAGLPTQVGAATSVLSLALKLKPEKTFKGGPLTVSYSNTIAPITFKSLSQFAELSINGSIWAGQHARGSGIAGINHGTIVAREVYANVLQSPGYGRSRRWFDIWFTDYNW